MSLFNISNLTALTTAGLGGIIISKGHEDYKKDKAAGLAKMIFGASVIGAGLYFSLYNTMSFKPYVNENVGNLNIVCTVSQWDENCTEVTDFVHNLLRNESFTALNNHTMATDEVTINLSKEGFFPEQTSCIAYESVLQCHISMKNITLLNGIIRGKKILSENVANNDLKLISGTSLNLIFDQGQEFNFIESTKRIFNSIFS